MRPTSPVSSRRGLLRAACAALAAAVFLLLAPAGCAHAGRAPALEGQVVPVRLFGGAAPGRAALLLFWASWCARCQDALRQIPGKVPCNLPLVAVSVDADLRFAEAAEATIEHDLGRAGAQRWQWVHDRGAREAEALGLSHLPTLFWIDVDGRARRVYLGWDRQVQARLLEDLEAICSHE